jgi:hypothetical protein
MSRWKTVGTNDRMYRGELLRSIKAALPKGMRYVNLEKLTIPHLEEVKMSTAYCQILRLKSAIKN